MQSAFLLPPSRTHPDVHTPHMAPRTACPSTYCPALTLMYTTHGSSYSVPFNLLSRTHPDVHHTWLLVQRAHRCLQDVGQHLGTGHKGGGERGGVELD